MDNNSRGQGQHNDLGKFRQAAASSDTVVQGQTHFLRRQRINRPNNEFEDRYRVERDSILKNLEIIDKSY